jgi:hypothetical protein
MRAAPHTADAITATARTANSRTLRRANVQGRRRVGILLPIDGAGTRLERS